MKATILSCLAVTAGCGFFDAGSPRVIAHRAGGEYWPENSEAAVRGAIAEGFEAIEIDVRLTADRVPVIFHDREISPAVCTYRNGEPIPADLAATLVVTEMTYEELLEWDCCGGPAMTLQELADIVRAAPELEIMLDVKTRDMPWTPEELAATVLEVWTAASPPNPWLVGAWSPDVIRAFRAWGRARNVHIEAFYMVSFAGPDGRVVHEAGTYDYLEDARAMDATGIFIDHDYLGWSTAEDLRARGMRVGVMGVRDRDEVEALSGWPIDYILTDAARQVQAQEE